MSRIGLVLGGGGVVGQAFHAGALTALEQDLGWDARTADVIVGTSAGAVTAALLRTGVSGSEIAAWEVGAPLSGPAVALAAALGTKPSFDRLSLLDLLHPGRWPGRALLATVISPPWRWRPLTAAATLLRDGRRHLGDDVHVLDDAVAGWPDQTTWICATRQTDARRVVFGRPGAPWATLAEAVAASCAVPGYFAPVEIAGVPYVDGGIHTTTNADILHGLGLDLVVVISPMSGTRPGGLGLAAWIRRICEHRLRSEQAVLERAGSRVLVLEPDPAVVAAMGPDIMDEVPVIDVVRQAFLVGGKEARAAPPETVAPLVHPDARGHIA